MRSVTMTLAYTATEAVADHENAATKKGPRAGRPTRRKFTAEYKLDIVAQDELLTETGAAGHCYTKRGSIPRISSSGNGCASRVL